jgi:hypothetical protein
MTVVEKWIPDHFALCAARNDEMEWVPRFPGLARKGRQGMDPGSRFTGPGQSFGLAADHRRQVVKDRWDRRRPNAPEI